jgi:hypothetical protein
MPQSRILGEEGGWQGEGQTTWIIDPIDGTSNFASGLPFFSVSIAAYHAGKPVWRHCLRSDPRGALHGIGRPPDVEWRPRETLPARTH